MGEHLADVDANVRDFGAIGDGVTEDGWCIQRAIDSGRPLLFPAGRYILHHGALEFNNARQRALFLADAVLVAYSSEDWVRITAPDQHIVGMRVEAVENDEEGDAHSPLLEIDGADRLLLRDFDISTGPPGVMVRIQDSRGCVFDAGRIHGSNLEGTIGIQLGDGAHEVRGFAVAIDQLDVSLDIRGSSRSVTFEACTFEGTLSAAIRVRGEVEGLVLNSVHFEGRPEGKLWGAARFLHVWRYGVIRGASITGTLFGGMAVWRYGDPSLRVFLVEGELDGVVVAGSYHQYGDLTAVWDITDTATISKTCDLFNFWDHTTVTTGGKADRLPFISDADEAVAFTAKSIQVNAERIGFCGVEPVAPTDVYTVPATGSRDVSDPDWMVLSQLIQDLAALGLVRCTVVP